MGQVRFENFDFLVKVKGPLGQSIFSLSLLFFFFLFFLRRFRPGQVSRLVQVKPGRSEQTGQLVVEDDVIHDVIALEARVARASA